MSFWKSLFRRPPSLAEADFAAARDGHLDRVRQLVSANRGNLTAKNEKGMTLLHSAAAFGHQAIVEFLITNGADLNVINNKKQTPLHLAAARGQIAVAELLATRGANVNAFDDSGLTPMDVAQAMHQPEVMATLLRFDARITRR